MMRIWITVNTVADTALAVVGLGIAGYAISARPAVSLLYYGVALVCVLCAIVGFCNLPVLHAAARQQEEKNARAREERGRVKAQKEAQKEAARAQQEAAAAGEPVLDAQVAEAAGDGGTPEGPCQD